jgi:hypothetical protein
MGFGAPGQFNTGTQQTLVITCQNPQIAPLTVLLDGRREKFESQYNDKVLEDAPCDNGGVIDLVRIPGTITGSLEMTRQNGNFAAVVGLLDAAFYAGLADTAFTITSYEPSVDGVSPNQAWQYQNLRFHGYHPGTWMRDSAVKPSVNFTCSQRVQIS